MFRFSIRAACLLLTAAAWPLALASGADLPLGTRLYIMSDANHRVFRIDPTAPLATTGLLLQDPGFDSRRHWVFLPSGQPGQVLIVHANTNVCLDADPAANDALKVSPVTATPPLGQLWRIIEVDDSGVSGLDGAFFIMNVQSGKLLDADSGTKLLDLGDSTSNSKWRLIPDRVRWTNPNRNVPAASPVNNRTMLQFPSAGGPKQPFFAPLGTGTENFKGKPVDVTVMVTLVGAGTNELTAQVQMTATDRSMTLQGTMSYSLLKAPTGKRIFLLAGQTTVQTCNYTDTDSQFDFVVPGSTAKIPSPLPFPPTTKNPLDTFIAFCMCIGDPGGPNVPTHPKKTGVTVVLESIPVFVR
jgi:hypothetical protein